MDILPRFSIRILDCRNFHLGFGRLCSCKKFRK